jgi:hypothetical protein
VWTLFYLEEAKGLPITTQAIGHALITLDTQFFHENALLQGPIK